MSNALSIAIVTIPATSANLGPGFDSIGMALDLRNRVTLSWDGRLGASPAGAAVGGDIHVSGLDASAVPVDEDNLILVAAGHVARAVGRFPARLRIEVENRIPVSSGLGSSSAAIVAGLAGMNALLGSLISPAELLDMAVDMEGHPDNVAPAMLGGVVLGVRREPGAGLITRRVDPPDLPLVVVTPARRLLTSEARAALSPGVARADAIFNTGRAALLLHSFQTGDFSEMRAAMDDRLHQPARLAIIPGAAEALAAAYDAGAMGVALSGAGPSLIAFVREDVRAAVGQGMQAAFEQSGQMSDVRYLRPSAAGVDVHLIPAA